MKKSLPIPCMAWSPLCQDLCRHSPAAKVPCSVPAHAVVAAVRLVPPSPKGHEPHTRDLYVGGLGRGLSSRWWDWTILLQEHPCQHRGCPTALGLMGQLQGVIYTGSSCLLFSRVSMTTHGLGEQL